ncbi:MAG: glutathione S-transferase family protein [Alphaproteobacteria bacterium]|nr:glutathione S-transferase family protein [Alphaproteobacteria bacterium]
MTTAPLIVWGRDNSSNVQKVLWTCAEAGLAHDRRDMGRQFGGNNEPWYLAINPNGLIPMLDHGGFTLWESNAICRYLARLAPASGLLPQDLQKGARVEQWMDWQVSTLGPAIGPMFMELVRKPPAERSAAVVKSSRDSTQRALKILDGQLAKTPWIAGDSFTLADVVNGIMVYRWYAFEGIEREPTPAVAAWYDRLTKRPHYKKHVMIKMT